ncbi:MAG: alginate lyase family protein, partial [Candidatus Fervidibacter sp.]
MRQVRTVGSVAVLAALFFWIFVGFVKTEVKGMGLPPHPRLLFNREGINELKERISRYDWAKVQWDALKRRTDTALKETVNLPPRGGNWWHYYACPKHGASLRTGKQIGEWKWEHICPVDNEVLESDPTKPERDYDGVVIMSVHGRYANLVRDLGIVYQVTNERRYAEKAKGILMAYADRYLSYPLHDIRGRPQIGGGRVGPQTLDEAVWLIPMAQGADLIWETLTETEQQHLAQKLFLPAVKEVILPHKMGVHNIQCWKNSAVGLVGFLLGDEQLIWEAIDNPERGYWIQMKRGVSEDGAWWEGAWGYHFYTLSALWHLTEAARNCGINLYGAELKRMFDAPFKFMMPNWRLPAFNDSFEAPLRMETGSDRFSVTQTIYELAYARYREPMYAALLYGSDRRSDFALWFGVGELPEPQPLRWQSVNYPASGYAILAEGEGEQATWLCLKYG